MTQKVMVRSFLAGLVSLSVLIAPAAAASPAQPADGPGSGWLIEIGDLLSRAWALVLGDRVGDLAPEDRQGLRDDGVSSIVGKDGSDGGPNTDPDG